MTLDEMYANSDLDLVNMTAAGKWELYRDEEGHIKIKTALGKGRSEFDVADGEPRKVPPKL